LADIIVTAQKTSESIQRTPLAITAISGSDLAARQINSIEGVLAVTPNVQFSRYGASSRISIRGLGFDNVTTGGEQRVAYHVDGVYLSRPSSIFGSFYDVARVEVLRGPQGTLYGRNATAGAINVITNDPTDHPEGYVAIGYGSYNRVEAQGAVTGPLADGVSARLAFDIVHRDGYGKDITTGVDVDDESTRAVRGKLKFEPSSNFTYVVSGDYLFEKDHAYATHFRGNGGIAGPASAPTEITSFGLLYGGVVPSNPRDSSNDLTPSAKRTVWGVNGTGKLTLGSIDVTSITAYRNTKFDTVADLTSLGGGKANGAGRYTQFEYANQFSQELRASYSDAWGRLTVGGYYLHEALRGSNALLLSSVSIGAAFPGFTTKGVEVGGSLKTDAGALFAQADVNITSKLKLSVGGRYSVERKEDHDRTAFNLATPYTPTTPYVTTLIKDGEHTWRSFNPKVTLQYTVRPGAMLYATYSTAFKSGGYNLGGGQAPFAPEKLTDYEAGVKVDWLDHRVRTNVSVFHYDYKDLQASIITSTAIQIINAAKARVDGIEADIQILPVDHLLISASGSLLNAKYRDFKTADPAAPGFGVQNLSGNWMTQAPPHSAYVSAEYTIPVSTGKVVLEGDANWLGRVYFSPFNRALISQPAYALMNASIRFASDHNWSLSVVGRNLTNKFYIVGAGVSTGLLRSPATSFNGAPRTVSAELRINF